MRFIQINLFFGLLFSSLNVVMAQKEAFVKDELILMLAPEESAEGIIHTLSPEYHLIHLRTLSVQMNIHVFKIQNIPQASLLSACSDLMKRPKVKIAQVNHYIEQQRGLELFPDDTLFANQWNLHNTGQEGGVQDADIDAPEAWDISTGGPTRQGDIPVIAVVDEGFNLNHPDLSWWFNRNELADNGIDDDNNGYIDDIVGWDAVESSGVLPVKLHGTHVSGIAGASGNNTSGISGVNWNAQLMPVVGFDLNGPFTSAESNVIAAYSYIYQQRRMYNESKGRLGAFVVATNTSFGLENTAASETPIWCAMFDSLGSQGILNAVATTNFNRNVDQAGDVPSTCSSPYVIAVTSSNRNDDFANRGFGIEHIDLAAPGEQILSTGLNQEYTFLTGTSMATPHIAGALSLMFSSACPSLLSAYKNSPGEVALEIRDLLLQGVDELPSLVDITASGGRLNLHQALLNIEELCASLPDCPAPFFPSVQNPTDRSLAVSWLGEQGQNYVLRYRVEGSQAWDSLRTESLFAELTDLQVCTPYEIQIQAFCGSDTSPFTPIISTSTLGCCEAPEPLEILQAEEGTAEIRWASVFGADSFWVGLFWENGIEVFQGTTTDTSLIINNLSLCTNYLLRALTYCADSTGDTSAVFPFQSRGCGLCLEGEYCEIQGNTTSAFGSEWIDSVYINSFVNGSGDNGGLGEFQDAEGISLAIGAHHRFRLVPGFSQGPLREAWAIWIDLNRNAVFEPEEAVYQSPSSTSDPIVDSLFIPVTALAGETRMRIAVRFLDLPPVCGDFINGEAEDYCVTLFLDSTACLPASNFQVVETGENTAGFSFDPPLLGNGQLIRYRPIESDEWMYLNLALEDSLLSLENLFSCTGYEIGIATLCQGDTSNFSNSLRFGTTGCGPCTDLPYCEMRGTSSATEWIASVQLGDQRFESGENGGYGNFTYLGAQVSPGSTLPLTLEPGFSGNEVGQQWRVWIDWDQNGSFEEEGELVIESLNASVRPLESFIDIPEEAVLGTTRMRVAMRFAQPAPLCEAFDFGEVEDYCLTIGEPISNQPDVERGIRVYPNPVADVLYIESEELIHEVRVFTMEGREVMAQRFSPNYQQAISVEDLAEGIYVWEIKGVNVIGRKLIWRK